MSRQEVIAYCLKCREKRALQNPEPVYTATGTPATRGICPICGRTLFKMGRTEAHASLPKPPHSVHTKEAKHPSEEERNSKLVIVESPAKARTVGRFLGKGYQVEASIGHVRDLLRSRLSVDVEHDFAPTYHVPKEKREVVQRLKKAVRHAQEVYLATDPDREGEAIAWHLMAAAAIPEEIACRVVFHEITDAAVKEAFAHPRSLDMDLVNAQQARRILDRLVGYKISPLLWHKVRSRLSAGRVQSVAVRLVVEREREIQAFIPVEYWSIAAELAKQDTRGLDPRPSFVAKLVKIRGEEVNLKDKPAAQAIVDDLEGALYIVGDVRKFQRQRKPPAPFITSSLQQEAFRHLGFTAKRTMTIAQQLYEGVDLGQGERVGLITYMRTDSTNIAPEAVAQARSYIEKKIGSDFLPEKPLFYKTRAVKAQEAHECIRPTSVWREPDAIRDYLDKDQYRLYQLIWKRFIACQMRPAIYNVTSVDIKAGRLEAGSTVPEGASLQPFLDALPYLFRVTGSTIAFPGFLLVYEEAKDEGGTAEEDAGALPPLEIGEVLDLLQLIPEQHFTQPPPRYTEASLIRELEKHGIGRPSTYAPILSTIQERGYVDRVNRHLIPTELGFLVNDLLVEHFPDIMDIQFTARMEEDLDRIAAGEREWVSVLREFYGPFEQTLQMAEQNMAKVDLTPEETGLVCEQCGSPMVVKFGRYGKFIACSNFPQCRNTKPYVVKTGAKCPECGGDLVERRTRNKRIFYGCANYPQCKFTIWQRPLPDPCPQCGGLLIEFRKGKAKCLRCRQIFKSEVEPEKGTGTFFDLSDR
ncbi:MAG: type I DNA topoisomerase [Chloroflexi bacterium]|nr:type I DNA topoisomerase [Chloroflexota bacterium]